MKKQKYKKRYVLGEGYPWADGIGPYYQVGLNTESHGIIQLALKWPAELWNGDLPKYRLILERVK